MLSSWDGENHKGPHWTLLVFPNGKMVLTSNSRLSNQQSEEVAGKVQRWMQAPNDYPLVIQDCLVSIQPVSPREFTVETPS